MQPDEYDESEFLPKDAPRINEFRLAKPDMAIDRSCETCAGAGALDGKRCKLCKGQGRIFSAWRGHELDPVSDIRFAQAKVRNILSFLHDTRIITDQHAHDGRTYEIWYEIFRASSSMEKKNLYGALRGELAKEGLSEYGFVLLIQKMHPDYHRHMRYCLSTSQNEHTRFLARRNAHMYRQIFDKLSELIPIIREELEAISQKNSQ